MSEEVEKADPILNDVANNNIELKKNVLYCKQVIKPLPWKQTFTVSLIKKGALMMPEQMSDSAHYPPIMTSNSWKSAQIKCILIEYFINLKSKQQHVVQ